MRGAVDAAAINDVEVTRYPSADGVVDVVAVEEPMEIRVDGDSLAVLMRTPGSDRALVAGFLLSEGVIDGLDDIQGLEPCRDPNKPHAENTLMVALAAGCSVGTSRMEKARRAFFATSSCGLCGKATIDNIHQQVTPFDAPLHVPGAVVQEAGERALAHQHVFQRTGGLHAATLFGPGPDWALLAADEDIGRHNAVDKVIGARLLADHSPLTGCVLWVSGRGSFEVVQKALMAGIGALICVGAPSSLAVQLAQDSRMTLVGFAKGGAQFNVYAGHVAA